MDYVSSVKITNGEGTVVRGEVSMNSILKHRGYRFYQSGYDEDGRVVRRPMFYHVFCVVAFLSVLVTYFGVNFILDGMHSYASSRLRPRSEY